MPAGAKTDQFESGDQREDSFLIASLSKEVRFGSGSSRLPGF